MAKNIFFSGMKGGTGKTTLAVHLCNYLFYHLDKKVVLISFDIQQQLSFLGKESPYPIIERSIKSEPEITDLMDEIKAYDFAVFDISSGLDSLRFHAYADAIAIPTEYFDIDLYKAVGFIEILKTKKFIDSNKIILIPNKQDRHINVIIQKRIEEEVSKKNIGGITPKIPFSFKLRNIAFAQLTSDCFYFLRPAFQFLLDFIQL